MAAVGGTRRGGARARGYRSMPAAAQASLSAAAAMPQRIARGQRLSIPVWWTAARCRLAPRGDAD